MPRWVKVAWVIAAVVVLAFVVSLLVGVRHGPGLHTPPEMGTGHTAPVDHGP